MPNTRRESLCADVAEDDIGSQRKKMTNDEEDKLITIILKYFDIIESKKIDKSLSAKALREAISNVWSTIRNEFIEETMVRI